MKLTGETIDALVSKTYARCCTYTEETGTIPAEQITLITNHVLYEYSFVEEIEHDRDDIVTVAGMVARILRRSGIKVTP